MTRERGAARSAILTLAVVVAFVFAGPLAAAAKPRAIVVVAFDASALPKDEQWVGEGVAQILSLAFAQHSGFVQIDRVRLRAPGQAEVWGESAVLQTLRSVKADAAMFGRVSRSTGEFVVHPRLAELRGGNVEAVGLEPVTIPDTDLLARLGSLPAVYARTLRVPLTEVEVARMDKASHPTRSLRAFELFTRGQMATMMGNQEGRESAVDLLARAIEADPNFAVAQYTQGNVHQALGNRWKAAAQLRAAIQVDPAAPEPWKALGDLLLAQPRRLFDQAVEAYTKAIELRPFFSEAHVGLGEAKAAKGDVDGAIAAFQKALVHNPVNSKVYLSLGRIYYSEKGLYYESVTAYKKAIDLDPDSVDSRMGLGEVYEEKGLYKEAIDEYKRVIDLDGKHTGALYNLALVYEKVDPREAVTLWERYISLASQLPSEKDWVDVARQHLRKLKNQLK
jgi:tetratricopeptide (TPR) repeat protein